MVGEPKFYGDTTPQVMELAREVCERDPEFVAKLAVYARRTLMLRSVSHMLACIVASSDAAQGTGLTRKCARGVVRRGAEATTRRRCSPHGVSLRATTRCSQTASGRACATPWR